jgi:hypothetical protein
MRHLRRLRNRRLLVAQQLVHRTGPLEFCVALLGGVASTTPVGNGNDLRLRLRYC